MTGNGARTSQDVRLINFDGARAALEKAATIDEIRVIRASAAAMHAYQRQLGAEQEMIRNLSEIMLRARRRTGELISSMRKAGALRPSGGAHQKWEHLPTLDDLGVSRGDAHRFQHLSDIPKDKFEEYLDNLRDLGMEPSVRTVLLKEKLRLRELSGKQRQQFAKRPSTKVLWRALSSMRDRLDHFRQLGGVRRLDCLYGESVALSKGLRTLSTTLLGIADQIDTTEWYEAKDDTSERREARAKGA